MPEQIHACVLTVAAAGGTKVRVTLMSGADFRAPHIRRGAIFESDSVACDTAQRAIEALELLGIPIMSGLPDGHEATEALLCDLREGDAYPLVAA